MSLDDRIDKRILLPPDGWIRNEEGWIQAERFFQQKVLSQIYDSYFPKDVAHLMMKRGLAPNSYPFHPSGGLDDSAFWMIRMGSDGKVYLKCEMPQGPLKL